MKSPEGPSSYPCSCLPAKPDSYEADPGIPDILKRAPNGLNASIPSMKTHNVNLDLSAIPVLEKLPLTAAWASEIEP